MPVSTISVASGGRPLLHLGRVWGLTSYGFYMPGKHRHQGSEVWTKIHRGSEVNSALRVGQELNFLK
jgi:hypothetical protein